MLTPLRAHLCRVCASRGMTSFGFTAATSVLKVHCRQYAASATSSSTFRARSEPESSSSPLTTTDFVAIRLPSSRRRLLRVSGADAFIYLQSLLSNDMRQLLPVDRLAAEFRSGRRNQSISQLAAVDQPLLYAFLLSAVGRVLADLFVYRGRYRAEDGEYILEVDAKLATALKRLLLGYNLSRGVKVELATDLDLWTILPATAFDGPENELGDHLEDDHAHELEEIDSDDIKLVADPRLGSHRLGYRFLTRLGGRQITDIGRYLKLVGSDNKQEQKKQKIRLYEGSYADYVRLRYRLSVAEGAEDIRSAFYYPFELNGDLVNAVSLNKGLYTSEEKTIKVYSREPIKRRLFPVEFLGRLTPTRQPAPNTMISAQPRGPANFGELRSRLGRHGLAVLWVPTIANNSRGIQWRGHDHRGHPFPLLTHVDTGLKLRASVPGWWPRHLDTLQLPVPDYPRCLFDLSEKGEEEAEEEEEEEEDNRYFGIPEDRFTSSLQVLQE